jgi:hypothetical protein
VMSSRSVFWCYAWKTLCRNPCSDSMFVDFGGILMSVRECCFGLGLQVTIS